MGLTVIAIILTMLLFLGNDRLSTGAGWPLNHGPWRYGFGLVANPKATWLRVSLDLLIVVALCSTFAALLRRDRLSLILVRCSLVAVWSAFYFLYWLID